MSGRTIGATRAAAIRANVRASVDTVTTALLTGIRESHGATVSPDGTSPTTGYAVGGGVPGVCLPWAEWEPNHVRSFVVGHLGSTIGAWHDTETDLLWLDVVDVLGDLRDALELATQRGELAIWDYANSSEVRTSATV